MYDTGINEEGRCCAIAWIEDGIALIEGGSIRSRCPRAVLPSFALGCTCIVGGLWSDQSAKTKKRNRMTISQCMWFVWWRHKRKQIIPNQSCINWAKYDIAWVEWAEPSTSSPESTTAQDLCTLHFIMFQSISEDTQYGVPSVPAHQRGFAIFDYRYYNCWRPQYFC